MFGYHFLQSSVDFDGYYLWWIKGNHKKQGYRSLNDNKSLCTFGRFHWLIQASSNCNTTIIPHHLQLLSNLIPVLVGHCEEWMILFFIFVHITWPQFWIRMGRMTVRNRSNPFFWLLLSQQVASLWEVLSLHFHHG